MICLISVTERYRKLGWALFGGLAAMSMALGATEVAWGAGTFKSRVVAQSSLSPAGVDDVTPPGQTLSTRSSALGRGSLIGSRLPKIVDELSLSVGQESYVNRDNLPAGVADYSQVSALLRTHTDGGFLSGALELGGSFSPNVQNYTNFAMPEGYLSLHSHPADPYRFDVSIGRKRQLWSQVDSDWALGLWQPLNRFDYLRPTEQGLTGGFFSVKTGEFEIVLFASSIFVPEQGAPFQINDNGKLTSSSPWFNAPPDTMIFRDVPTEVHYRVDTPDIASIVNHPSGGMLARLGDLNDGGYAQVSAALKPRNQIVTPFEGKMDLNPSTPYATVTVRPQVIYHNLTDLDIGYRSRLYALSFSALHEEVMPDHSFSELNHEVFAPLTLVSPKIEFRLLPSFFWGPKVSLSYLQAYGGEVSAVGPLASSKGVFGPRVNYRQAASVGTDTLIYRSGRVRVEHGLRWIEEFAENGSIVMTDLRFKFGDSWRVTVSADVLGSRQPLDQTNTFIARYRGNDRVTGLVSYVF
jgi:hypothetical protein